MNVNSTSSNQTTNGTSDNTVVSNDTSSSMDTMFMQLLVAQIQNQDPLNPMDGTEYVNQLAQLTQVQSMESMSQMMTNNMVMMDNMQTLSTSNLVDQQVMVQTTSLESDGATTVDGRLTLDHASNVVNVILKDEAGAEYKVELGNQDMGSVDFSIDPEALGMPAGKYTVAVVTDSSDSNTAVELGGKVNNVRIPLDGSTTVLNITGIGEVAYNNISQIGETTA
jgi:flagellar basal-body rod modification protein FlgD